MKCSSLILTFLTFLNPSNYTFAAPCEKELQPYLKVENISQQEHLNKKNNPLIIPIRETSNKTDYGTILSIADKQKLTTLEEKEKIISALAKYGIRDQDISGPNDIFYTGGKLKKTIAPHVEVQKTNQGFHVSASKYIYSVEKKLDPKNPGGAFIYQGKLEEIPGSIDFELDHSCHLISFKKDKTNISKQACIAINQASKEKQSLAKISKTANKIIFNNDKENFNNPTILSALANCSVDGSGHNQLMAALIDPSDFKVHSIPKVNNNNSNHNSITDPDKGDGYINYETSKHTHKAKATKED